MVDLNQCMLYAGTIDQNGYGILSRPLQRDTNFRSVHRLFYSLTTGQTIVGELDHLCRVRRCFNPAHLEEVDHRTNLIRGKSPVGINARKTYCIRGHLLLNSNLYRMPNGARSCRTCRREQQRIRRQQRRQLQCA